MFDEDTFTTLIASGPNVHRVTALGHAVNLGQNNLLSRNYRKSENTDGYRSDDLVDVIVAAAEKFADFLNAEDYDDVEDEDLPVRAVVQATRGMSRGGIG